MTYRCRALFGILVVCLIASETNAEDKKSQTIMGWGTIIDSLGDCTVKEEKGKLTIEIPGGTHDLNAILGGMTAPRVLKEVEGDFTAQVKISGEFKPGEKSAKAETTPFNGAGLLLWQDEKNYLRLERNIFWAAQVGKYACLPPLVEYYEGGQYQGTNPEGTLDEFFKGKSTWLKLERRGSKVIASFSHDGKEWEVAKEIDAKFPKKVQIGVAAVNTSAMPFTVEFEQFKVVSK
jgi:regulation of enolase protein 1 (concanavalin A-like superfamily)